MDSIEIAQIRAFLEEVGNRYQQPARLYLLGGSALCLLGSPRPTLDIDFVGNEQKQNALQEVMQTVANDMAIDVEAVPIAEFVPLPAGAEERQIHIDRFGLLDVYVFDPYTIALSKLDRGFDTDIDDIVFLVQRDLVTLDRLESIAQAASQQSIQYDLDPPTIRRHLEVVKGLI